MRHRVPVRIIASAAALFLVFIVLAGSVLQSDQNSQIGLFDAGADRLIEPLRHSPALELMMRVATSLGNLEVIIGLEACLLGVLLVIRRKRVAALFLAGIVAGELASLFFKNFIDRARPEEIIFHVSRYGYSFPSGHALISIVFYGCLAFFAIHLARKKLHAWLIGIFSAILIFSIGFSRVYLGVHWASDVLGGWLLGGSFLLAVIAVFYKIHSHTKAEKITDLSRAEAISLAVIALALGFFLTAYYVTHIGELRSIV